ncbi:MAG: hypothetical protein H6842_12365 [Rhodospirillaceae bacterium]|nr:hypothetical protein [Rhodospirillaceae bacterium]
MPPAAQPGTAAELEDALEAIVREARLAGHALCRNEILVRLENIARIAREALAHADP